MEKPTFDPSKPFEIAQNDVVNTTLKGKGGEQKPAFDATQPFKIASGNETDQQNANERPWYAFDPRNMGAGFLKGLENVATTYDKYTGAPIRKFVTEKLSGKELDHAPSGSEQAKMLGASDTTYKESWGVPSYLGGDISPADIYGVGLETVQDPFVIASGVKKIFKAGKPIAESLLKSGAKDVVEKESVGAFKFKPPESLDELRNWKPSAESGQMPGKQRLKEIVDIAPDIETKPLQYHYDMMDNPKSMKQLKLEFENLPTNDAKKIAQYNRQIVDESTSKIKSTVNNLVGNEPKSLSDAGSDFIGAVKEKYNAEKDILGPVFNEVQKKAPKLNVRDSQDLIVALGENSKLGKVLSQDKTTGRFVLGANTPRTGLSDNEFKVLRRVVDDLNDGMTFEEIQKARDFLRKAMDPVNPAASAEIGKVRSIMLGQLENMAEKIDPQIGKTFKAYAVNEKSREAIEKIIGGRIETFDAMYAANPEKVVQKVFSNPNYSEIVKGYIGPEKMNEMIGSFINSGIEKATDSARGFSPEKFKSWLNRNSNIINKNVPPEIAQRLSALADYGYYGKRFLDEVNPSGTAASLQAMLEPTEFLKRVKTKGVIDATVGEVADKANDIRKGFKAKSTVNKLLGKPKVAEKSISKIDAASKFAKGAAVGRLVSREQENKEKGPAKWASNGFKKLQSFSDSKSDLELSYVLDQLDQNDKKVQKLLIEASDFKPGSVGFQKVVEKLRKMKKRGK